MNKRSATLFATTVLVLLPHIAFAHVPPFAIAAGFALIVLVIGLVLMAKLLLVSVLFRQKQPTRMGAYIVVGALEFFIMWLLLLFDDSIRSGTKTITKTIAEMDPRCYVLYLSLAFLPNLYLVKTGKARAAKAFILAIIFPSLFWTISIVYWLS